MQEMYRNPCFPQLQGNRTASWSYIADPSLHSDIHEDTAWRTIHDPLSPFPSNESWLRAAAKPLLASDNDFPKKQAFDHLLSDEALNSTSRLHS
ncbi:hypothetical protein D3C80_1452500 [compost metagenome]